MFLQEEIIPDQRPFMAVFAPKHGYLFKYFDRHFDRRITNNPQEAPEMPFAVLLLPADHTPDEDETHFRQACKAGGKYAVTLRLPIVIGTGMTGTSMRVARGVARGTLLKIKDNNASWSIVHATDVARVADIVSKVGNDADYTVSAPPVGVNALIEALGRRIKDKYVGTISSRIARIVYGKSFYNMLTSDNIVDSSSFSTRFPDFEFVNPAEYLTSHVYDNESL